MKAVRSLGRWLLAAFALLAARLRRRSAAERVLPAAADDRAAVRAVVWLLLAAALAFAGFSAGYLLELGNTFLGGMLALGFGTLAAAAIAAAKRIVPQEEVAEDLGERDHRGERAETAQVVREGAEGLTRRRVLFAAGGAGCAAAAALVLPVASLGPVLQTEILRTTPWRTGRRLVDAHGEPIHADAIEVGSFVTALAEGADPKAIDSSLIVARVEPGELRLPDGREAWAPEGLLAYSKICTHAGCAVSLFEYPAYPPTQPQPRLICPCHYSAFDAAGGGDVLAGPAGRPLPQLPLRIREDRSLEAGGGFSGQVGPSWSGVRET